MREQDFEAEGFVAGFYRDPPSPPRFYVALYMRGYWAGCHERRRDDDHFETLCQQWEAEDRALAAHDA